MMKTKKATSKFVSVLSVILALAMLSTTVVARRSVGDDRGRLYN